MYWLPSTSVYHLLLQHERPQESSWSVLEDSTRDVEFKK